MLLVRSWLFKAQSDLIAARQLATFEDAQLDVAIYHCQQTAEKAVKAYLVYRQQPLEWTHDVRLLVIRAVALEPSFAGWLEAGQTLTPYASIYRYPLDPSRLQPERGEFEQALVMADGLYQFVLSLLPDEAWPTK
jgi:HEPN domain-containing protein